MTGEPSQYPNPVFPGGLRSQNTGTRTLRKTWQPLADIRQPYLGSPPNVQAITGFGTGSGAMIQNNGSDADQSQGLVAVMMGLAPSNTGTVMLRFPVTPPTMFFTADWASLVVGVVGNVVTLTWTQTAPTLTPGRWHYIAYQWATSQ